MTEPPRFTLYDFLMFAAVLVFAAAPRIAYQVFCTDAQHPQGFVFVQDPLPAIQTPPAATPAVTPDRGDLGTLIDNVKADRGFISKPPFADKVEATADTAPGYPILVGLLARVVDPAALDNTVQWIQVALGTLTSGIYFLFARRAFRSSVVGLLAGIMTAAYPFWIINTAAINDGTLTTFALALVLWFGVRAGQSGGAFSSILFGLLLAGLALTRAYYFPFTLVAMCWFLLRSRLLNWGWLCALVAFLGFVAGLAPWTVRNYQVFGEPVPIVDSAYYHLWIGNNSQANGGPLTESMVKEAEAKLDVAGSKKLAELPQPERYDKLGQIVRDTVRDDPLDVVNWRINSTLNFFLGKEFFTRGVFAAMVPPSAGAKDSENHDTKGWADDAAVQNAINITLAGVMIVLLGLGVLGWRWTYAWRTESMPAALAMLWIPLPYILTHAEMLHGPRLPLDGVLLSYGAFALCCCVPGLGGYLLGGAAGAKSGPM